MKKKIIFAALFFSLSLSVYSQVKLGDLSHSFFGYTGQFEYYTFGYTGQFQFYTDSEDQIYFENTLYIGLTFSDYPYETMTFGIGPNLDFGMETIKTGVTIGIQSKYNFIRDDFYLKYQRTLYYDDFDPYSHRISINATPHALLIPTGLTEYLPTVVEALLSVTCSYTIELCDDSDDIQHLFGIGYRILL